MTKRMLIDAIHSAETRVAIADNNQIIDFDFTTTTKKQLKGNIYLAKITRVEPSLQAAFVEYGGGKQGFLPFSEIHADYYQIPVSDRQRLMKEANAEAETEETETPALENQPEQMEGTEGTPAEEIPQEEAAPSDETQKQEYALEKFVLPDAIVAQDHEMPTETAQAEDGEQKEFVAPADDSEMMPDDKQEQDEKAAADKVEQNEAEGNPDVETLPSEEEEMQRRKRKSFFRRYKIQEVIRRGQVVLVQVIKEERGNKGVSLTTYLSLAGRYCVLMPNSPKDGGISRKIASSEDRKRLKAISTELKLAEGMSVIIRTAGMDRSRAEIKRDYDYLVKLWNTIRDETLKSTAPAIVYEESDIIKRAIRDQYSSDIEDIIVEGEEGFNAARDFMKLLLPSHTPKIKQHTESTPLFYAYNVEDQLLSMHDPVVKLRSGGYIVMNPTEALISIDVNSGRSTGERNIEETATKTNLEAAAEIARQLRLRDLAGLIVIDFIDMLDSRNRRSVERALKDALKMDRAKIQLGRISPFGLLEMSRQRLRPSISETNMVQCGHCVGRGFVRSNESMSIQMIRALEKEASTGSWNSLRLILPQAVAMHLLNSKRDMLKNIEQTYNLTIQVLIDSDMTTSDFNLEKMRRGQPGEQPQQERGRSRRGGRGRDRDRDRNRDRDSQPVEQEAPVEQTEEIVASAPETVQEESSGEGARRGRGRRGRRGGRGRHKQGGGYNNEQPVASNEVEPSEAVASEAVETEQSSEELPPKRHNQRGGRKRMHNRDNDRRPPRSDHRDNGSGRANDNQPDAAKLPSFATEAPKMLEPKEPEKVAAIHALPPTPRDPNAPAKKGWWQKMIQLDE